jgi:hypothetical protein
MVLSYENGSPSQHKYLIGSYIVLYVPVSFVKALQHPYLSCYTTTLLYAWNNLAASGQIFIKLDIWELF